MKFKKYKLILLVADTAVISIAVIVSYWIKQRQIIADGLLYMKLSPSILMPFSILILSLIILFKNSNLYKMHVLFDSYYQFVVFVKSILISYGILITTLFFFKHPLLELRGVLIPSFAILFVLFPVYRILALKYAMRYALKNKIIGERVILVGAGSKGREIARELLNNKYTYFTPIGFLDDEREPGSVFEGLKVIDKTNNIGKYAGDFDAILIALTNATYNKLQRIINRYQKLNKPIHIISDLYRIIPEKLAVEKFDGFSTFQVPPTDELKEHTYIIIKRIMDVTTALVLIIGLLPLWIFIAVLIKMESEGPFLYTTEVVGYREKRFRWYKFRSMYHGCDDTLHRELVKKIAQGIRDGTKLQNDPRVTRTGRWLRKYSIDEFPQLINVLKGQMSLVGPRPVLPYEYELLDEWQKERFSVLPGMTGLWQVRGRNKVNIADQHVLDLYYVRNRSLSLDLVILFNTVSVVISGKTGV